MISSANGIFALFYHTGNFSSEVILALLDALALFITDEFGNLDGAAQLLAGLLNVFCDINFSVLNKGLLEQADFLIELVDTAIDHLFLHLIGLAGQLGIVLDLGQDDLFLLGNYVLGNAHGASWG